MKVEPKKRTLEEVEAEAQEILRQEEKYNLDGNHAAAYAAGLDSAGLMHELEDLRLEEEMRKAIIINGQIFFPCPGGHEEKGREGPSKNIENPENFQTETAENPGKI